jgi:dienelactone hydrolase
MNIAGGPAPDLAEADGRVHVRFEPGEGSTLRLGDTPWPDDLYLDRTGHIAASGSVERGANGDQARMLSDLDGFGVSTPVYFYVDGAIDRMSLPTDEASSLDAQASAFLIDADTGSPDAFTKIPVVAQYQADAKRIALRPADGHPLTPGRRYAAVITRRVKDTRGVALEPAAKFAAIRDPDLVLSDARLSAARAQYTPVLETLVKSGLPRSDISAMAVFHVQNVDQDLTDARRIVRAGKSPVLTITKVVELKELDAQLGKASGSAGFDASGAAPHSNLYAMVHGTLPCPNLLSATQMTHGEFERDSSRQLRVKRTDAVEFTLFVPRTSLEAPIVIYQHQRDGERSDALAIADELASRGLATLALDAPFQGQRAPTPASRKAVDWRNRFSGAETTDQFGDAPGDFLGFVGTGPTNPWSPLQARDSMRQAVVELMVAMRAIEDGGLEAATARNSALKERTFLATHVGFIGEDTGASIGAMLARIEPTLQAIVLVAPAGGMVTHWAWSARDQPLFETLATQLGYDTTALDRSGNDPAFWPDAAIYQTLFDRADPLAHVAALRRAAVNVLVLMAEDDEWVANRATEGYAAALGTTLVGTDPRYVVDLKRDVGDEDSSGNYNAAGNWVTRSTYVYSPATHDFLQSRTDLQSYAHPPEPPFEQLTRSVTVQNPTAAAARQIGQYLQSFFACVDVGGSLPSSACSASPN